MSVLKSFLKNTFIYGIAAVLPKAINVLLIRLHTETLSTSEYSVNTIFYVWAAYFNILLTYGMETAFFRFFNTEKEKQKVASTAFISIFCSSIAVLLFLLYFRHSIALILGFSNPIYFTMLLWIVILDALTIIPFAYLRVTNKAFSYTLYKILYIGVYGLLNLFFLWYIPTALSNNTELPEIITNNYNPDFKEGYIFVSNMISSAITFLVSLGIVFKFKLEFDCTILKKMLIYGWPVLLAGMAYITNENLDKLLLEDWLGKDIMGAYAGAYKIGLIMSLFILAFRLGAEPFFFNHAATENAKKTYAVILNWFTIAGSLLVLFVVVYLKIFANILLGNEAYHKALNIVPLILMANLFFGIYNNLSIWYKLTNKTIFGMYISIIGALLTIISLFVLIPVLGYVGAAWATVIAYGSMMVISYLWSKKYYPVEYPILKIGIYLTSVASLTYISVNYQQNYWIGTLLILLFIALVVYLEKKTIYKLIWH